MALSNSDKEKIIDMLDDMSRSETEAILASKGSFTAWLKRAASWLWERIKANIDLVFSTVFRLVLG